MLEERALRLQPPQVLGAAEVTPSSLRLRSPRSDDGTEALSVEEKDPILEAYRSITPGTGWTAVTVLSCVLDLINGGALIGVAIHFGFKDVAASLGAAAVQVATHCASSLLLLVRLLGDLVPPPEEPEAPLANAATTDCLLRARRKRDVSREEATGRVMDVMVVFSCITIFALAARKALLWEQWYQLQHEQMDAEVARVSGLAAWFCLAAYVLQALLRFAVARHRHAKFIWHCWMISCVSAIAFATLAVASTFEQHWWKAEPIAAIVLAFVMLGQLFLVHRTSWPGGQGPTD
mmetsp:Transcript_13052/g.29660  ORF Transcript_13052/g.29660 Transcript_13052/m.29660 type:complete len:292 (-) Transcript_13052:49-924(-)